MTSSTGSVARKGVLLINLGTPDAPTVPAVRKYLAEFLSDPRVIDLSAPARWLLLNCFILPFRPRRSAHAYQQIWTDQGSPLLVHSKAQAAALQALLPQHHVVLGMRYGTPSLQDAFAEFRERGIEQVTVVPLYPQFANATTGTTLEKVESLRGGISTRAIGPFFSNPEFIQACADRVQETVASSGAEHVLFSYHGLPVRQIKPFCKATCGASSCPPLSSANHNCYRAQCFVTSREISQAAGLQSTSTAFQSRIQGTQWLSPFTEESLIQLAQQGVKRVAVACPAFVTDCLETLEEIGQRAAETFKASGGESLTLVPAVNDSPRFMSALVQLVSE
jgi:ferrochelatase